MTTGQGEGGAVVVAADQGGEGLADEAQFVALGSASHWGRGGVPYGRLDLGVRWGGGVATWAGGGAAQGAGAGKVM
jgi:hypothetical protein